MPVQIKVWLFYSKAQICHLKRHRCRDTALQNREVFAFNLAVSIKSLGWKLLPKSTDPCPWVEDTVPAQAYMYRRAKFQSSGNQ